MALARGSKVCSTNRDKHRSIDAKSKYATNSSNAAAILIEGPDAALHMSNGRIINAPIGLGGFLNQANLADLEFNNVTQPIDVDSAEDAYIRRIRIDD